MTDKNKTGKKASKTNYNDTTWTKGMASPNPRGNTSRRRRSTSRLRQTISKLEDMVDTALDNVERVVNGEDVDKQAVDTSKWVIATIPSMSRAATQEETLRENVRARQEDKELAEREMELREKELANGTTGARFSSNIIPFNRSDEEEEDY